MNTIPSAKECALHGVTEEIKYFVYIVGVGFHPDNNFHEYVLGKNDLPLFTRKEAIQLDIRLDECISMCNKYDIDIYGITLQEMYKINQNKIQ